MRKSLIVISLCALMISLALASDDGSWFDMQNCEMCRPLMETKGLMGHMTWEHHKVSAGLVSVTNVDADYMDSYKSAQMKMDAVAQRWMKGEPVYLCNMCKSMGSLLQSGAVMDQVESGNSFIRVMSSSNPEVIGKIHEWADRTNKEMQAMAGGESTAH